MDVIFDPSAQNDLGFYADNDLDEITSLSKVTRWRMAKAGKFPRPVQLTPGRVGYPKAAVHAWIRQQMGAASQVAAASGAGSMGGV